MRSDRGQEIATVRRSSDAETYAIENVVICMSARLDFQARIFHFSKQCLGPFGGNVVAQHPSLFDLDAADIRPT